MSKMNVENCDFQWTKYYIWNEDIDEKIEKHN